MTAELPIERAVLKDGSTIHIRPIESGDHERLRRAFERLSPESRYRRFLGAVKRLNERELRYFTEVDHVNHEALVAIEPDDGELVGVARYVRGDSDAATAEVAMAVADDWHGRGVATLLLDELVERAEDAGIARFTATCLVENTSAIDILEELGTARFGRPEKGLAELTIDLADRRGPHHALRHAARGNLRIKSARRGE
jgi:RimJ/RimL family protein N-acetyltransferase